MLLAQLLTGGARAAPYYEIPSQSNTQESILTTAYFSPELYANTDYGVVLGLEHVVKPYNSDRDMQVNLAEKSFTIELWLKHDRLRFRPARNGLATPRCSCQQQHFLHCTLLFPSSPSTLPMFHPVLFTAASLKHISSLAVAVGPQ